MGPRWMLGGRARNGSRARGDEKRLGWQVETMNVDFEVDVHGAMGAIYVMDNTAAARSASDERPGVLLGPPG